MKRLHVHVAVTNLEHSIRFYSSLFAAAPTVTKPDYAKWMLEDPRVNFAISARGAAPGLDHLGLQVESDQELSELHARLEPMSAHVRAEPGTACCYARSDKYWITDPQGIAWESFHSLGSIPLFGGGDPEAEPPICCEPSPEVKQEASCRAPAAESTTATRACC